MATPSVASIALLFVALMSCQRLDAGQPAKSTASGAAAAVARIGAQAEPTADIAGATGHVEDCPSDGQVLRDAGNSVSIEPRRYGNMGPLKRLRVQSKKIDQYERDECNTVTEGRMDGRKVLIFGAYFRTGDFWKLRTQEPRIY